MRPPNADIPTPVAFPFPPPDPDHGTANSPTTPRRRSRTSTVASNASSRIRSASIKFMEASPPPGMWAATGTTIARAPTLSDIRRGSSGTPGRHDGTQEETAEEVGSGLASTEPYPPVTQPKQDSSQVIRETSKEHDALIGSGRKESEEVDTVNGLVPKLSKTRQYSNGYVPPPKVPWTRATAIGLKAFWKWFITPAGFLITIYGLNIVAWGGMLFLLLCNAAPAMCKPTCNDINSPRRKWIEVDSQILNALFCVTGFGLAPWRFRDLYWWAWWRLGGVKRRETGIRRLAGIHRGWYRLQRSDTLPPDASAKTVSPEDPAVPIPIEKIPDPPPTGVHAPPTKPWKMDFVVWMNVWNTLFQIVLCFYMWHYNRYDRPSWATGLFVALGCIVAGLGGIMMFHEGKHVKRVEGVPIPKGYENYDVELEAAAQRDVKP
ncbi:uncharacterized protein EI97DRAFT_124894 [Westerdykella ornata]|uniref:Uncharacterized protein n=1 Tax=Westerdykella ornata TaxID=318751 RepID=A0A6A6JVA4_WESOR|nr:uncharacterized protein EI97DRAFT_124894 [Westerdykella ornata]KAF2280522.1 hypothetical protein EI97DRAFT_124894 [Westerdykella ornata]